MMQSLSSGDQPDQGLSNQPTGASQGMYTSSSYNFSARPGSGPNSLYSSEGSQTSVQPGMAFQPSQVVGQLPMTPSSHGSRHVPPSSVDAYSNRLSDSSFISQSKGIVTTTFPHGLDGYANNAHGESLVAPSEANQRSSQLYSPYNTSLSRSFGVPAGSGHSPFVVASSLSDRDSHSSLHLTQSFNQSQVYLIRGFPTGPSTHSHHSFSEANAPSNGMGNTATSALASNSSYDACHPSLVMGLYEASHVANNAHMRQSQASSSASSQSSLSSSSLSNSQIDRPGSSAAVSFSHGGDRAQSNAQLLANMPGMARSNSISHDKSSESGSVAHAAMSLQGDPRAQPHPALLQHQQHGSHRSPTHPQALSSSAGPVHAYASATLPSTLSPADCVPAALPSSLSLPATFPPTHTSTPALPGHSSQDADSYGRLPQLGSFVVAVSATHAAHTSHNVRATSPPALTLSPSLSLACTSATTTAAASAAVSIAPSSHAREPHSDPARAPAAMASHSALSPCTSECSGNSGSCAAFMSAATPASVTAAILTANNLPFTSFPTHPQSPHPSSAATLDNANTNTSTNTNTRAALVPPDAPNDPEASGAHAIQPGANGSAVVAQPLPHASAHTAPTGDAVSAVTAAVAPGAVVYASTEPSEIDAAFLQYLAAGSGTQVYAHDRHYNDHDNNNNNNNNNNNIGNDVGLTSKQRRRKGANDANGPRDGPRASTHNHTQSNPPNPVLPAPAQPVEGSLPRHHNPHYRLQFLPGDLDLGHLRSFVQHALGRYPGDCPSGTSSNRRTGHWATASRSAYVAAMVHSECADLPGFLYVSSVIEGSPAHNMGLMAGDIVLALDGIDKAVFESHGSDCFLIGRYLSERPNTHIHIHVARPDLGQVFPHAMPSSYSPKMLELHLVGAVRPSFSTAYPRLGGSGAIGCVIVNWPPHPATLESLIGPAALQAQLGIVATQAATSVMVAREKPKQRAKRQQQQPARKGQSSERAGDQSTHTPADVYTGGISITAAARGTQPSQPNEDRLSTATIQGGSAQDYPEADPADPVTGAAAGAAYTTPAHETSTDVFRKNAVISDATHVAHTADVAVPTQSDPSAHDTHTYPHNHNGPAQLPPVGRQRVSAHPLWRAQEGAAPATERHRGASGRNAPPQPRNMQGTHYHCKHSPPTFYDPASQSPPMVAPVNVPTVSTLATLSNAADDHAQEQEPHGRKRGAKQHVQHEYGHHSADTTQAQGSVGCDNISGSATDTASASVDTAPASNATAAGDGRAHAQRNKRNAKSAVAPAATERANGSGADIVSARKPAKQTAGGKSTREPTSEPAKPDPTLFAPNNAASSRHSAKPSASASTPAPAPAPAPALVPVSAPAAVAANNMRGRHGGKATDSDAVAPSVATNTITAGAATAPCRAGEALSPTSKASARTTPQPSPTTAAAATEAGAVAEARAVRRRGCRGSRHGQPGTDSTPVKK